MEKRSATAKSLQPDVVAQTQHLQFRRSDVKLLSTPFGIRISMKGLQSTADPGAPALPFKLIRVALPAGHGFKRLTFKSSPAVLLNHTPEPVASVQQPSIGPDDALPYMNYRRSFAFPEQKKYQDAFNRRKQICRFAGEEMVGLVPVALIQVWPVCLTREGLLSLHEEITLTVESESSEAMDRLAKENGKRLSPRKLFNQHIILNDIVVNKALVDKQLRKSIASLKKDVPVKPDVALPVTKKKGISAPVACDYLIITDNNKWDSVLALQGSYIGDITGKFRQLANWKKSRGLRTHVAQVKDIVDGLYGDFMTGSRDLAEVIRNFLKWFCGSRGVEFVLLGGDVSIIPARRAASCAWGRIYSGDISKDKNCSVWKGSYLGMRVDTNDFNSTGDILTNYDTGVLIPYDSAGTSSTTTAGWYYTTDDTFATFSSASTEWVRVNGPSSKVNAVMVWYTDMNLIPTDFYYASLYGSGYSVAGKHDWDHLNNHLYGQHSASKNFDNVEYHADVSIGRASVESVAEAEAFVNKVLDYEKWGSVPRPDSDYDRFRSMLYAATTWGKFYRIEHDTVHAVPENCKYKTFSDHALLHCDSLPPDAGDQIICFFDDHYYRRLTYRSNAGHSNPGWYYAKSSSDLTPSVFSFSILWFHWEFPVPTPWIVVWDGDPGVLNPMYFGIDYSDLDSSVTEQESLREKMLQAFPGIDHVERLYTDEADMNPAEAAETWLRHLTADNLKAELNKGPHFVSLTGHGNWNGCAFFSPGLVNTLVNGPKTFILYADSCLTGKLDVNDCVAEVATNFAHGAAVAYIGNTRFSWIGLGAIYRELFFMRLALTRHLGEMNDSRLELLSGITGDERLGRIWYCYNIHLFGDPEMPVYRTVAEAKNFYIGNSNTDELHDCRCQWVERMTPNHKVYFEKLQDGLNAGYDGCGFCLRKYNTK